MEAVVFNLFRDIPLVTRCWLIGSVGVSILTSTGAISRTAILYNYDLVFHKKQYLRMVYSLFDNGELNWSTLIELIISVNDFSRLENAINSKRRFIWMGTMVLMLIIIMTSFTQPSTSLGTLLHQNMVYYLYKTRDDALNVPGWGGNQFVFAFLPLNLAIISYLSGHKSLLEVSITFVAGHTLYYCDNVLNRLYGIDISKNPYDHWKEWRQGNIRVENEVRIDGN